MWRSFAAGACINEHLRPVPAMTEDVVNGAVDGENLVERRGAVPQKRIMPGSTQPGFDVDDMIAALLSVQGEGPVLQSSARSICT